MLDLILYSIINQTYKSQLHQSFGDDCEVVVNYVKYSTNTKKYLIDCKLITGKPELAEDIYPYGIDILVEESWKLMAIKEPYVISSTIDIKL